MPIAAASDHELATGYTPDPGYCNPNGSEPLDTFTYTLNGGSTATVSVQVRCPG
jgi:hypothetical protein